MTENQKQQLANRQLQRFIATDCGWRAAIHILRSRHFADKPRAWRHVDLERRSISFGPMIAEGWSETEEYMLCAASSLFNGDHALKLYFAFNRFNDSQARVVIQAMMLFSFGSNSTTVSLAVEADSCED